MARSNPSVMQRFEDYRPSKSVLMWSCIFSIAATMTVGFVWGGWVTRSTATEMATKAADSANTSLAASICVTQFNGDPTHAVQLAALNKIDRWDRAAFITKGGWATLPGMKEPANGAADLCAQQLTAMPDAQANPIETSR